MQERAIGADDDTATPSIRARNEAVLEILVRCGSTDFAARALDEKRFAIEDPLMALLVASAARARDDILRSVSS